MTQDQLEVILISHLNVLTPGESNDTSTVFENQLTHPNQTRLYMHNVRFTLMRLRNDRGSWYRDWQKDSVEVFAGKLIKVRVVHV